MRIRPFRERPGAWVSGPDPVTHRKYRAFIQQRNQANYRGEPWDLTFEEWCGVWGERFDQRGRRKGQLCLTRTDYTQPWTLSNVELLERRQHNLRQIEQVGRGRNGHWGEQQ